MSKTSLFIDPNSGGYIAVNNTLVQYPSTVNKANLLLKQPIGGNIYAPNDGNPLINTKGILSTNDIAQGINTCLAPLVNSGEISVLSILQIRYTPTGRYLISIGITLPDGTTQPISWKR